MKEKIEFTQKTPESRPTPETIKSFLAIIEDLTKKGEIIPVSDGTTWLSQDYEDENFRVELDFYPNPEPDPETTRIAHGGVALIYSKGNKDLEVNYNAMSLPEQPNEIFVEKDTKTTPSLNPTHGKEENLISILSGISLSLDEQCSDKELKGLTQLLETFKH